MDLCYLKFLFAVSRFFEAVFVFSFSSIFFLLATLLDNKEQWFHFFKMVKDRHMSYKKF